MRAAATAWLYFSVRRFQILAPTSKNRRNLLLQKHFPHSAFYSAVFQNLVATTG